MIKVVLIEDHALMRLGLRQLLEKDSSIKIVGEAETGAEGIQLVRSLNPDVILLDINLPDISGLEVTTKLHANNKEIKILIITSMTNELFPIRLLEAGALGYISKNTSYDELIHALKTVNTGKKYVSAAISQKFTISKFARKTDQFSSLSDRELEVVGMIMRGINTKKIAQKLNVTTGTIYSYRSRIFQKLHVNNQLELITKAVQHNIIKIDEKSS